MILFFIQVRQATCSSAKGKEFLCPDKVTASDDVDISFYFKTKSSKGGKQKSKAFINGKKWPKKQKTKTDGKFTLTQSSKKAIKVEHSDSGMTLTVTRLKGYFKFDVEVPSAEISDDITGLCQSNVITPERGSSDLSATLVSLLTILTSYSSTRSLRAVVISLTS